MALNSDFYRQLEQTSGGWKDADYQLAVYVMLPFGLFLLFQGHPRMKITHVLTSFFFTFTIFGNDMMAAKDLSAGLIGGAKVFGGGVVLAFGIQYCSWLSFAMLGMFTGLLLPLLILQQFTESVKNMQDAMNSYQEVMGCCLLVGMIIPLVLKEKLMIYLSVLLGTIMLTMSTAYICQGPQYYNTMNKYKFIFLICQIAVATLGFVFQNYFKKKEEKMKKELEEENAKNVKSVNAYQNANALQNQRPLMNSAPVYEQPRGMPVALGYPPIMQHPMYHPPANPVVYNQMNVSANQQKPAYLNVSSPVHNDHKSVRDIKADLANIHIKPSNKNQYDF